MCHIFLQKCSKIVNSFLNFGIYCSVNMRGVMFLGAIFWFALLQFKKQLLNSAVAKITQPTITYVRTYNYLC